MTGFKHNTGARSAIAPGSSISGTPANSIVVRDVETARVDRDDQNVYDVWDGHLTRGSGKFSSAVLPAPLAGSIEMGVGDLYIRGTMRVAPSITVVQFFPIVVTKGTVQAGSVGTDWCVLVDEGVTYVAMVSPSAGNDAVEIGDTDAQGFHRARIGTAEHFVELPGHSLPRNALAMSLKVNPPLDARVQMLKQLAREVRVARP
jgi:hypothetical protein